MPDDKAKQDDKTPKTNDAAKKGEQEKPISDADAQTIAGGRSVNMKWDKN